MLRDVVCSVILGEKRLKSPINARIDILASLTSRKRLDGEGKKIVRNKLYPSEYLALLSIKYEVDADKFFNALISSVKNRKSECGDLSIECRSKQNHKIILLITRGSKVVAQFQIPEEFLSKQHNPIKEVKNAYLTDRHSLKKCRAPQSFQIKGFTGWNEEGKPYS